MSWWIVPLGLVVGVVVGSLGTGGGILAVPILTYLLGQDATAATTGSLVIAGLSSLVGAIPHLRRGQVRLKEGVLFGVVGVLGTVPGSAANHLVPAPVLMSSFALLLIVVAGLMVRRRRARARGDTPAGPAPRRGFVPLVLAATAVGLLTGFFGVGGGFAVVPALVLVLGFSMRAAVGTSLVVMVVNSLTALVARAGVGIDIDWPLIGVFGACAALGSLAGAQVAQRVDSDTLDLAFTVVLLGVAALLAVENVPLLF